MRTVIHTKSNDIRVVVSLDDRSTRSYKFMGEDIVTLEISHPEAIAFAIGDYVTINGIGTFYLNTLPPLKKTGHRRYEYTAVFESTLYDLGRVQYLLFTNDPVNPVPQGETYLFGKAQVHAEQIIENLNRVFSGWSLSGALPDTDAKNIQYQNESCLSALHKICDEFELEFIINGKAITIGKDLGTHHERTFKYGRGLGLYELERKDIDSKPIITRLYPYGSERNIPADYRNYSTRLKIGSNYIEKNVSTYGVIEHSEIFEDIYPQRTGTITAIDAGNVLKFRDSSMFNLKGGEPSRTSTAYAPTITPSDPQRSGTVDFDWVNSDYFYVQAGYTLQVGDYVKECLINDIVFTGTYYRVELQTPITVSDGEVVIAWVEGASTAVKVDKGGTIREGDLVKGSLLQAIDTSNPGYDVYTMETAITVANDEVLTVADTGYDYLFAGTPAIIHFQTGALAGYEFEIVDFDDELKEFTIKANEDSKEFILPSDSIKVSVGDTYVLLDIRMPQSYIDEAEQRLLEKAQEYLNKYSVPQFAYDLKIDPIYIKNYPLSITPGDWLTVSDAAVMVASEVRVLGLKFPISTPNKLEVELAEESIPTVEQVLYREKQLTRQIMNAAKKSVAALDMHKKNATAWHVDETKIEQKPAGVALHGSTEVESLSVGSLTGYLKAINGSVTSAISIPWSDISGVPPYGSVTSVGLGLPSSVFEISGSPVTTSGTLTGAFKNQSINTVFAGPASGSAGVPSFRSLVANDIPDLSGLYKAASYVPAWADITGKPTTLSGYGITDAQPLDADLTSIAGLTGTTGLLRKTAANTWSLDTNTYLTGNQTITLSGDATGSGATSIAVTLANSGVTAGTYNNVATQVRPFTVDAKGRITGVGTAVTITPDWSSITNKPTTFTPSAHTHTVSSITDLTSTAAELNYLHGTTVTPGLLLFGDGGKITNSNNLYWDNVNGRLGIGITPTSELHVNGVITSEANLYTRSIYLSTSGGYYNINVPSTTSWVRGTRLVYNVSTVLGMYGFYGAAANTLDYMFIGAQASGAAVKISPSGCVGIGLADYTVPSTYTLEVNGSVKMGVLNGYIKGTSGALSAVTSIPPSDVSGLTSGNVVTNLNADMVDGYHASSLYRTDNANLSTVNWAANNLTVAGTSSLTGSVGINVAPSSSSALRIAQSNSFAVYSEYSGTTSSNRFGIHCGLYVNNDQSVTSYNYGIRVIARSSLNSGITNNGNTTAINVEAFRNNSTTYTDDNGTLNTLRGISIHYGNYNTNAASPQTNSAHGIYIVPHRRTGSIENMVDLYMAAGFTGGTVTNAYGIYQENTKLNYFAGSIKTNSNLQVVGTTTLATSLTGYLKGTSGVVSSVSTVPWGDVNGKPTTLSGYGITDALPLSGGTLTGLLTTAASTTTTAGLRLPHGTAPTSPVNGDVWTTTGGLFARINGETKNLTAASHSHTSDILYWDSTVSAYKPYASAQSIISFSTQPPSSRTNENLYFNGGLCLYTTTNTVIGAYSIDGSVWFQQSGALTGHSYDDVLTISRNNTSTNYDITGSLILVQDSPTITGSGVNSSKVLNVLVDGESRITFTPRVANSSSALAYLFDTKYALTTAGSLLLSIRNSGTEKFAIRSDGGIAQASTAYNGFFGATPVAKPTALTSAATNTVDSTYGSDEATVINNLRTRVNELEAKLRSLGLLT